MALVVIPTPNPGVAGFELGNEYTQVEVFYGEQQLVTEPYKVAAGAELPIYTVVGLNGAGELIPAAAGNLIGVTSAPAKGGDTIDVYRQAYFNDQALCWPTGTAFDTLAERKAAFLGSRSPGILINRIPTHGRAIPNRTGIVNPT